MKVTVKVIGIVDTELLEYHWGPDWMVWDAQKTAAATRSARRVQPAAGRATSKTRVRFTITVEPSAPLPEFWVNRARKQDPLFRAAGTATARHGCRRPGSNSRSVTQCGQSSDRLVEGVVAFAEGEAHQVIPHIVLLDAARAGSQNADIGMAATPTFSGSAAQNAVLSS